MTFLATTAPRGGCDALEKVSTAAEIERAVGGVSVNSLNYHALADVYYFNIRGTVKDSLAGNRIEGFPERGDVPAQVVVNFDVLADFLEAVQYRAVIAVA